MTRDEIDTILDRHRDDRSRAEDPRPDPQEIRIRAAAARAAWGVPVRAPGPKEIQ